MVAVGGTYVVTIWWLEGGIWALFSEYFVDNGQCSEGAKGGRGDDAGV